MRPLLGTVILVAYFFAFSTLYPVISFWPAEFLAERSAVKCMGFPLYVTCCFSLAACNILSLCLIFVSLTSMFVCVFILGFILYGTLCTFWIWLTISFSTLGKFSTIISSKMFLYPFFFSYSGTPIIRMLVHLLLSQRSLRLSSVLFILFPFSVLQVLFPSFYLPAHWFLLLLQIFCYWVLLEYF